MPGDEPKNLNLDEEGNLIFDESNPDAFEEQDNKADEAETDSTPNITRKEDVKNIFIKYTEQELAEKGKALASEFQSMREVESQKKDSADGFNEKLKGCQSTIREIADELSAGGEYEMTEVEIIYNWEENTKTIVTKEDYLVSEGPIPDDERQRELFAAEKPEKKTLDMTRLTINEENGLLMNGEDESEDPENRK